MQTNLATSSPLERYLYSYQKALDETLSLGALPRRLFKVFYPIRVIDVYGRQRIPTDMEEIQRYIERAIHDAGLSTSEELQAFLGLDGQFVNKFLLFLSQIGHLANTNNKLSLTLLGLDSLEADISYQEYETSFMLYFDAFGNQPLSQEHFRVKVQEEIGESKGYWIFPPIFHNWDPTAMTRLQQRSDRSRFGLLDEVVTIMSSREDRIVYMPVYIVERVIDVPADSTLPIYLVFSTVKGYRDFELEKALNGDAIALNWLKNSGEPRGMAIKSRFDSFGIKIGDSQVHLNLSVGTELVLRSEDISHNGNFITTPVSEKEITIQMIGKYLLASEWCIWLTCEDKDIRWEASIQNCLQWLEHSYSEPTPGEIDRFISTVNNRLALDPEITAVLLLREAGRRGASRAMDRLSSFEW